MFSWLHHQTFDLLHHQTFGLLHHKNVGLLHHQTFGLLHHKTVGWLHHQTCGFSLKSNLKNASRPWTNTLKTFRLPDKNQLEFKAGCCYLIVWVVTVWLFPLDQWGVKAVCLSLDSQGFPAAPKTLLLKELAFSTWLLEIRFLELHFWLKFINLLPKQLPKKVFKYSSVHLLRTCTHVRMYLCMHACVYECVCVYVGMIVCACMRECVCVCVCMCAHVCMYLCMYAWVCVHVCICVCVRMRVCVCVHACRWPAETGRSNAMLSHPPTHLNNFHTHVLGFYTRLPPRFTASLETKFYFKARGNYFTVTGQKLGPDSTTGVNPPWLHMISHLDGYLPQLSLFFPANGFFRQILLSIAWAINIHINKCTDFLPPGDCFTGISIHTVILSNFNPLPET